MLRKRVWVALIIIIVIYGFINQEYEGLQYLKNASRVVKHIVNYSYLFLVAGVGYWGWSNYKYRWTRNIWLIFYALSIIVITIAGLLDVNFFFTTTRVRDFFHELRFFSVSPVPFALLLFLSRINLRSLEEKKLVD